MNGRDDIVQLHPQSGDRHDEVMICLMGEPENGCYERTDPIRRTEGRHGTGRRDGMSDRGAFVDAVVVGAGPFGLGVSYHLQNPGVRHRVFERRQIAESWRTQRWDNFRMNTPNVITIMPGGPSAGPDGS